MNNTDKKENLNQNNSEKQTEKKTNPMDFDKKLSAIKDYLKNKARENNER
jgi:hypothetical protein